jgi:hypothetical protein
MVENILIPQDEPQLEMLTTATPPIDVPPEDIAPLDAPAPDPADNIEVASIVDVVKAGAKAVMDKGKSALDAVDNAKPIGRDIIDQPVERRGDFFVIRDPSDAEMATFNNIIDVMSTGVPSPSSAQRAAGVPVARINFERVNTAQDEKELMDQILQTYKDYVAQQKRGSISFDQMIQTASEKNQDGVFDLILNRAVGQPLAAEDIIAGRMALWSLNAETTRLNQLVLNGTATAADRRNFMVAMSLEGKMAANLLGGQAEAARATAASRIGINIDPARVEGIQNALYGATEADIDYLAHQYAVLPTQEAKAQFSRGILGKTIDVWQEVWMNSLLSAFTTHAVNVGANLAFVGVQIPERFIAGAIGSVRRGITKSTEGVRMGEALSLMHGIRQGLLEGLLFAAKAFKDESPISGGLKTKLEARQNKAITAENFGLDPVSTAGRATDLLGVAVRLPGRFLVSEDEFFKGLSGRMQLHALSYRRMMDAIDGGMPVDMAKRQYEMNMRNPGQDLIDEVGKFSEMVTFQKDLEGFLGNMQTTMSHPLAKIFVPFFKTPSNIVKAVSERSPLALMMPSFYKAIKAGGAEADAALAKIALGTSVMATFATFAGGEAGDDVIITGSGPTAPGSIQAFQRQGLQPYSFNFKQDDGTYKSVSYSRFDPISGVLAIAADYAEYAKYEDDPSKLEQLTMGASLAAANYLGQLPMLQGMANVSEIMGSSYTSTAERMQAAMNLVSKQATSTVLGPMFGGSMMASIERYNDPTINDTRVNPDTPPIIKGFYEALNQAKSRNPLFAKDLPPKLNLWGEQMQAGYGEAWEMVSPIRIKDAAYNAVDQEIEQLSFVLGSSLTMPSRKIDGVGLEPEQYNQLITHMNIETIHGKTMKEEMLDTVLSADYQRMGVDDKVKELRDIMSEYRDKAEAIVIRSNPGLAADVEINKLPYEERKMMKSGGNSDGLLGKIQQMVE